MEASELAALEAQNKEQDAQMKAMMKQMGLEEETIDRGGEEDEYDKVLKQLGINPDQNGDEDIMAMLNKDADEMDDDALLEQIGAGHVQVESPRTKANKLKEEADGLKDQMKALMAQGRKPEAAGLLKQYKAKMADHEGALALVEAAPQK